MNSQSGPPGATLESIFHRRCAIVIPPRLSLVIFFANSSIFVQSLFNWKLQPRQVANFSPPATWKLSSRSRWEYSRTRAAICHRCNLLARVHGRMKLSPRRTNHLPRDLVAGSVVSRSLPSIPFFRVQWPTFLCSDVQIGRFVSPAFGLPPLKMTITSSGVANVFPSKGMLRLFLRPSVCFEMDGSSFLSLRVIAIKGPRRTIDTIAFFPTSEKQRWGKLQTVAFRAQIQSSLQNQRKLNFRREFSLYFLNFRRPTSRTIETLKSKRDLDVVSRAFVRVSGCSTVEMILMKDASQRFRFQLSAGSRCRDYLASRFTYRCCFLEVLRPVDPMQLPTRNCSLSPNSFCWHPYGIRRLIFRRLV